MTQYAPSYKAYSAANSTVSKTRQVVMLFEGAVRFLQQAAEAMRNNDPDTRYAKLTKTSEIMMALQSSLDFEARGGAVHILNQFYASVIVEIMALHRTHDVAVCTRLIAEIKEMRDTWDAIDRNLQSGNLGVAANSAVPIADPAGSAY